MQFEIKLFDWPREANSILKTLSAIMEVLMLIDFDPYRLSEDIYTPVMNYKPLDNEAIAMYYHVMAKLEKISAIEEKSQVKVQISLKGQRSF